MTYRELPPPPELRSHVVCTWVGTGNGAVLPDGYVDLVWTGHRLVVAGPSTRAFEPEAAWGEVAVGVRFRIGAAGAALGMPASELVDRSPAVASIWAGGRALAERVGGADPTDRPDLLVDIVARRLHDAPPADPAVRRAAVALSERRPRVGDLDVGLGERQLRRRFLDAVGYSPKALAGVLRFQRFLTLADDGEGLAALAVRAGYADQAHLTRECSRYTGVPPGSLLARRAPGP